MKVGYYINCSNKYAGNNVTLFKAQQHVTILIYKHHTLYMYHVFGKESIGWYYTIRLRNSLRNSAHAINW